MLTLVEGLSPEPFNDFLSLWDEYRTATSPEAVAVKAFDKLETLMQRNQGINPPLSVDFVFSLSYGREYTDASPLSRRFVAWLTKTLNAKPSNTELAI